MLERADRGNRPSPLQNASTPPRRHPRVIVEVLLDVALAPPGLGDRLGEDRGEHQHGAERSVAEPADGEHDLPPGLRRHRVGDVGHHLLGGGAGHRREHAAARQPRDGDGVVTGGEPHVGAVGRPADRGQRILVLGEHHAEGVAERSLVGLVRQEPGHVAQRQPPEPPDRRVRLEPVAKHALLVVELQILDDRSVEDDQRFRAGRVA